MVRVTITQMNAGELHDAWPALVAHTSRARSDVVLLPEMAFSPWLAVSRAVHPEAWDRSVAEHDRWIGRFGELHAGTVAGTRPVIIDGRRLNEGFVWTRDGGYQGVHLKTYLPDEPGFWEATWYERGPVDFRAHALGEIIIGFQICTEVWFTEHARAYGTAGTELLLVPRATPAVSLDRWIAAGRVAAISAGAFSVSSNHSGRYGGLEMAGGGWICAPDGDVLGTTSAGNPFVTRVLDFGVARDAKSTYPRYVDTS